MEILEVIWQALLHDLAQMPRNWLTPCITVPIITAGGYWLATRRSFWKPLAVSLIAMGWGGMFYGGGGLIRLSPLFIDVLKNIANWDWAWIPTIVMHLIEFLVGFWLYHWTIRRQN